jgi:hypothetical protein
MFRLRFVVSLLVVGLLSGGLLLGEDKKPEKEPIIVKAQLPANYKKLGLSDQQRKDIYKIRGKYAAKIEELQQKIAALKEQEKTEVESVLTDVQKARLKEIRSGTKTPSAPAKPAEAKKR